MLNLHKSQSFYNKQIMEVIVGFNLHSLFPTDLVQKYHIVFMTAVSTNMDVK